MDKLSSCLGFAAPLLCGLSLWAAEGPSVVKIVPQGRGYQLLRNGQPYFIKGVCGNAHLDELVAAGGNSIRTYGPSAPLDEAQKRGLTVLLGLEVGRPRHGFDYSNPARVAQQLDKARQNVLKYKDHPALLMWALGNETVLGVPAEKRVPVWKAINEMAEMVKKLDPNHPVITVQAGPPPRDLNTYAPALDAVGINTYGGILTLGEAVARLGWTRPWLVTEFGPLGFWEVPKTPWGLPLENSSTEKAEFYLKAYHQTIEKQPACLGSYVFLWGQKQEKTHTWFGMFLPEGNPLSQVDAMTFAWTGKWPAHRCPQIGPGKIQVRLENASKLNAAANGVFPPGARLHCTVDASAPDGQPMTIRWDLRRDVADNPNQGGDPEPPTPPLEGAIVKAEKSEAIVQLPPAAGNYRLFVYVIGPAGSAATANVPLQAHE